MLFRSRRGLIVNARVDAPLQEVLGWVIAAGSALSTLASTGFWRADIYLPKIAPGAV